jgi:streptogramin lyase
MSRYFVLAGLFFLTAMSFSPAQDPSYPRINVAVGYIVDPAWPQRPKDLVWAEMSGIAVDGKDNVYLFTRGPQPVQVFDAKGKFLRSWGHDTLKTSHHLRIDPEGNVWAADIGHHTVEKYTPEGKLLLTLGTKGAAGCDATHFFKPTDVAVTPAGDIFVADGYGNSRIAHFDRSGKFVKAWGELGAKPGQFSAPHSIVVDSKGRLYVADRNNARIQVFDQSGKLLDVWNHLLIPWGLWVTKQDEIWACGSTPMHWRAEDTMLGVPPKDQVLMKLGTDGRVRTLWMVPKGADGLERPGEVNWVHCIAADSKGHLYVGDIRGKRAQRFVPVQ